MRIQRYLDKETWRKFVFDHPQGNIFHTVELFEIFEKTKGHKPSVWAAVEGEDRVLALLLPVEIVLYNHLRRFSSRSIVFGGVLWEQSNEGCKGLNLLLDKFKKETRNHHLFTELRNISQTTAVQDVLHQNKFFYEDHLNYLINLDCTPDEVMQNFRKRTRKHISRGLRKGKVNVEFIQDRDRLYDCYDLIEKTYQYAQIPIADVSMFEAAFDILAPNDMVHFVLATVDDVPVATSVELLYKDTIYGWYSGMDRNYSSFTPNELLMWHILSWGAENDYKVYDFGGAGKPDEDYGVRDFKAKFGGELVNFGRNKHIPSPVFYKFAEFGYEIARRILLS